ncbi:MAG: S-layer homology domain-containing protein [Clostridia bacterium]|nr:S-layer homology domain-containing protein [Clostridia bacterium]
MKKRILSILLITVLLLGIMPFSAAAATTIDSVAVRVKPPEAGRYPAYAVNLDTDGIVLDVEDDTYGECQENGVVWFCGDTPAPADQPFEIGKVYTVRVLLLSDSSENEFAVNPAITVNGQNAHLQWRTPSYISIEYTFPALEGHTVTFSAGSGSGTMAAVNNIAGEYTLPACGFTAPYSSQVFKCWKISTDSNDWYPDETIHVFQDITVTAVWKNKDSRAEVFDVEASSEDLASIPVLYGKKSIPQINTTNGHPAYVTDSTGNLRWQRKEGDTWVNDNTGRFTPGEWRIATQVRIDERSDPDNEFVLGDPVTLTVNGQAWTPENGTGKPTVAYNYSMIFFVSPTFVIVDDPNIQPPASVGKVTLRLEGYQSGRAVANAVVKGNDRIDIGETVLFEANSIQDLEGGDPSKIREASGTFSADKYYAAVIAFSAKDGYVLDHLVRDDVSFENATEYMESNLGEVFRGVYFLNPPAKYTVTFYSNGGSAVAAQKLDFGKKVTKPADPTKSGYVFKGWTLNGAAYNFNTAVSGDMTLYAAWEAKAPMTNPFVDVKKSDYFYAPVLWAVEKEITNGMDATHFAPNNSCTRGQVVTFLWRAAGKPKASGSNPFKDVKKGDYFYDAVLWAVEKGITNGMDATHFAPDATCTRGQIVTFLYRAAGKPKVSGSNPFKDVKKTDYFYDAVLWAVKNEITNGMDATHFGPASTCTRGQVVTFLYRKEK